MTNGDADKSMSRQGGRKGETAFKFSKEGESQSLPSLSFPSPPVKLM